ncbi:uncharacterized protein LOC131605219 [Vicia villosa]|uniref:uncharacterized protein LOC131605219 n=1 Tax=Vicia villosa TaxID=3911 RepID=UPI00273C11F8|nr:uncharacterized protein LOC131605219 [Vicia villosa]
MIQLDLQKAYDMLNWRALETILQEMGIPSQFAKWIMNGVTTVTYRYNINGEHSKLMKAERGIRQGDPISPYLFVIVMEYMSRLLKQMQENPQFRHHSKCKKLGLTHLTFADDILLLARGDLCSVSLLHQTVQSFSESTGLYTNPQKCHIYMGATDEDTKQQIINVNGYKEGQLPFKYLGIPLTSKKLSNAHYLPLIEKILSRLHHWSARLLSHAGRVQLIKAVGFAIANYWMQCFPIPKTVIKKINTACRTFIWTGGTSPSRKSPIAWKNMCKPMAKGGLNILDLDRWNTITMLKLLWDLCKKNDSLWVKWMHMYFIKNQNIMTMNCSNTSSWIIKGIMATRSIIPEIQRCWDQSMNNSKFKLGDVYKNMLKQETNVEWQGLIAGNVARPRAVFCLWMACHKRLATRDRLGKFGVSVPSSCGFCQEIETIEHLFFECERLKYVWANVLQWIRVDHTPQPWDREKNWITKYCKGKGKKCGIMKLALAETIYYCWKFRNDTCFGERYVARSGNGISSTTLIQERPGRPRKVRIRELGEEGARQRRHKVEYKCTKCDKFGHNALTCKSLTQDPNALKRKRKVKKTVEAESAGHKDRDSTMDGADNSLPADGQSTIVTDSELHKDVQTETDVAVPTVMSQTASNVANSIPMQPKK